LLGDDLLRTVLLVDSNRSHGGRLHGDIVSEFGRYLLVKTDECPYLVVDVYVLGAIGSLYTTVERQFHLLTGLARLLGHQVGNRPGTGFGSHQCTEVGHMMLLSYF